MKYLYTIGLFAAFVGIALIGGAVTGIPYRDFMIGLALFQVCALSYDATR